MRRCSILVAARRQPVGFRRKRAMITIDAVAGVTLAALVAVTAAQLAWRGQRAAAQRATRTLAVLEAENMLERARAADEARFKQLVEQGAYVSQSVRQRLPGGRIGIALQDEPTETAARIQRLTVSVSWGGGAGAPQQVEVIGWRVSRIPELGNSGEPR